MMARYAFFFAEDYSYSKDDRRSIDPKEAYMFGKKKNEKLFSVNYIEDTTFNGPTKKHKKVNEETLAELKERADVKILSVEEA